MCVIPLRLNNVEYSAVGNNVIKLATFRQRIYQWLQLEYISLNIFRNQRICCFNFFNGK